MIKKVISIASIGFCVLLTSFYSLAEDNRTPPEANSSIVKIEDPWIAEAPPKATVLAGYLQIKNLTTKEFTLNGATSTDFDKIEIHETVEKDGQVSMIPHPTLPIPVEKTVSFQPGGFHLMLIGAKKSLKAGDKVEITLNFQDDVKQTVTMEVKKRDATEHANHHQ